MACCSIFRFIIYHRHCCIQGWSVYFEKDSWLAWMPRAVDERTCWSTSDSFVIFLTLPALLIHFLFLLTSYWPCFFSASALFQSNVVNYLVWGSILICNYLFIFFYAFVFLNYFSNSHSIYFLFLFVCFYSDGAFVWFDRVWGFLGFFLLFFEWGSDLRVRTQGEVYFGLTVGPRLSAWAVQVCSSA